MLVWPPSLPTSPIRTGYEESYPNNLLESSFDAGVKQRRRKGATPPFKFSCQFVLTEEQLETLKEFVQDTLEDGVLRFTWEHPRTAESIETRFSPSGETIYKVSPQGTTFWLVSTDFEILP